MRILSVLLMLAVVFTTWTTVKADDPERADEAVRSSAGRAEEVVRESGERAERAKQATRREQAERETEERRGREVREVREVPQHDQREARIRHLLAAAEHLQDAGLEPMADELRRMVGRIREEQGEQWGERRRGTLERPDVRGQSGPELRELHGQIERLTREMNELRQFVQSISGRQPERRTQRND